MALTLSVFMGNYNDSESLPRAIVALMEQSRPPDELVIVDDGSRDNSVTIIREFQRRYPVIRLIVNDQNRGILHTIKRIPSLLKGDFIYGASANDYVLPCFFKSAMAIAEVYPRAGIIFGEVDTYNLDGRFLYNACVKKWDKDFYAEPRRYLTECLELEPPQHSWSASTLYNRSSLVSLGGFRVELGSWCDTFVARALGLQLGAGYIARPCVHVANNANSVSGKMMLETKAAMNFVQLAENMMSSPEYKDIFPAEHIKRWARGYRLSIIGGRMLRMVGIKNPEVIVNDKRWSRVFMSALNTIGRIYALFEG